MQWMKECSRKSKWSWQPKNARAFLDAYGEQLRTATINETMGPLWKPIIWIPSLRTPFVFKETK